MNALKIMYAEYARLQAEMELVSTAIIALGGTVPTTTDSAAPPVAPVAGYPLKGTWKEKILFVLSSLAYPATVGELEKEFISLDPSVADEKLKTRLLQYCYMLQKSGDIIQEKAKGSLSRYSIKK